MLISSWWVNDLEVLPSIIWLSLLGAIYWGLWKERNCSVFEDKMRSHEELCLYIYRMLFNWISIMADFVEDE